MSGGLVGRVEQLLELNQERTQGEWVAMMDEATFEVWLEMPDPDEPGTCRVPFDPPGNADAPFVAAAVNLVEPLARVALAAEEVAHFYGGEKGTPIRTALDALRVELRALAAVSGESDVANPTERLGNLGN